MIRIIKPADGPPELAEGMALVEAHEAARQADPKAGIPQKADPNAGIPKTTAFKFDKGIFTSNAVTAALSNAQHRKCCYCEGLLATDVEHFRPKTRSQQARRKPYEYPGYYWLAYEWSNLYMACVECNRTYKRSLFPLKDPSQRNHSADDDNGEVAMIVDPGGAEDPRDHIRFDDAAVKSVTDIGRETIVVLRLDRGDLTTFRLNHLKLLDALHTLTSLPLNGLGAKLMEKRQNAIDKLPQMVCADSIYSSMAQDFLNR